MLEGLCDNWGFYFVCAQSVSNTCGSRDLSIIIEEMPSRSGFSTRPGRPDLDLQCDNNDRIAVRSLKCVLAARMIILRDYLRLWVRSGVDLATAHKRWVLALIHPEVDNFLNVAVELRSYSMDSVDRLISEAAREVGHLIGRPNPFFVVIDEAQAGVNKYSEAFRTEASEERRWPVLSKILQIFRLAGSYIPNTTMILSGTGIHYDAIKPVMESNVLKNVGFKLVTATGAFGKEDQREYLVKYLLPGRTCFSLSETRFLERAWHFLRGR
jgi:hypothetical protein